MLQDYFILSEMEAHEKKEPEMGWQTSQRMSALHKVSPSSHLPASILLTHASWEWRVLPRCCCATVRRRLSLRRPL